MKPGIYGSGIGELQSGVSRCLGELLAELTIDQVVNALKHAELYDKTLSSVFQTLDDEDIIILVTATHPDLKIERIVDNGA